MPIRVEIAESMNHGILSAIIALIVYHLYDNMKDLPFHYMTQTEYPICHLMNGTFCGRISYLLIAVIIYWVYIQATTALALPVNNALQDPPANAIHGIGIGAGIAILSIVISLLFGFVELKGINYDMLTTIPIIIFGMMMTGMTEELIFRALPINALRPYVSESLLVIGTACVFGMVHMQYSFSYGITAFIAGLLLGFGFLKYGLFWAAGLHASFNTVETAFYSTMKYKVKNPSIAGERKTPDDDGLGTSFVELALLCFLKYTNYL
jgi:membrane protease YdiL (CAAX protease family)